MTGWPPSLPSLFWDYVRDTDPTNENQVEAGEKWFDTANSEGYVWDGAAWDGLSVADYSEMGGTIPQADISDDTIITRMVAEAAITATQIAANSVGNSEVVVEDIEDIAGGLASDGLTYDDAASAINAALGTGLGIDTNGNIEVPADTITAALIAADAVTNTQIAADAVTNTQIAADAVDTTQVANDAITAALIAAGAVGTTQIATDAVTATEIAASTVDIGHLSFDTATQSELDGHAGDTTNPHSVTYDQTGAATALSDHANLGNAHQDPFVADAFHYDTNISSTELHHWTGSYQEALNTYSTAHSFSLDLAGIPRLRLAFSFRTTNSGITAYARMGNSTIGWIERTTDNSSFVWKSGILNTADYTGSQTIELQVRATDTDQESEVNESRTNRPVKQSEVQW